MLVSKIRPDRVFEYAVEYPDGTSVIPRGHTFTPPPELTENQYAVLAGSGWVINEGIAPPYPPLPPPPTPEQIQEAITESTQNRLDRFARTRNYDGILSACTYATSSIEKFRVEGQYCVDQRDATWSKLYEILGEVLQGIRNMPSGYSEIESELPILEWPV